MSESIEERIERRAREQAERERRGESERTKHFREVLAGAIPDATQRELGVEIAHRPGGDEPEAGFTLDNYRYRLTLMPPATFWLDYAPLDGDNTGEHGQESFYAEELLDGIVTIAARLRTDSAGDEA